ncbi:MAG: hypothetical protein E5V71_19490 [Mesorhizobium sp.]|nr:MAG: hypothetical protein E5V71_19490 [Mesorhizobium sp.]
MPRMSHSMGGPWCRYAKRDEALRSSSRATAKACRRMARVRVDKHLRNNLLFEDGTSPGWPLLKALAPQQSRVNWRVWSGVEARRKACRDGRG